MTQPSTEHTEADAPRNLHWSFTGACKCKTVWRPAKGTHDTITGQWLPDVDTFHVSLDVNPACPIHGQKG